MRRNRAVGLLLLGLVSVPGWLVYRSLRQDYLNHALIAAIKRNDTPAALALLSDGADANACDDSTESSSYVRILTRWFSRLSGQSEKRDSSVKPSALLIAFNPDWQYQGGSITPPENITLLKALLDASANVRYADQYGRTALLFAAYAGYQRSALLLLERGADVNARSSNGATPLICAPNEHSNSLASLLLDHGAMINAQDDAGATALIYAVETDDYATAKVLLARGADTRIKDIYGNSPLQLAKRYKEAGMIVLLKQAGVKE